MVFVKVLFLFFEILKRVRNSGVGRILTPAPGTGVRCVFPTLYIYKKQFYEKTNKIYDKS
jgi:hypothetical protein